MTVLAERVDAEVSQVFDLDPHDSALYAALSQGVHRPEHLYSLASLVERAERLTGGR